MLVLCRREGERILIGDEIEVAVTRLQDGRVYLGFDAPKDVRIRRAEIPAEGPKRARRRVVIDQASS